MVNSVSTGQHRRRFGALFALFAFLFVAAPALAGGYDDFSDGEAALTEGNYELAIELYTRAIRSGELSPENLASANSGRGSAYIETGNYDRALLDFGAAIRLAPDDPWAWIGRGQAYSLMAEREDAIREFDQAIRLNAGEAYFWVSRGFEYSELGQYAQAIRDFDEAVALYPMASYTWLYRATTFLYSGDYRAALDDLDEAVRLDQENAYAWATRGAAYSYLSQYKRAIGQYDQSIALDPDDAWTWNLRGIANFRLARYGEAAADHAHALRLDPEYHYSAIWAYLARARAGEDGGAELKENARRLNFDTWPGPVVLLFLGKTGPDVVLNEARDKDAMRDQGQRCEAQFYLGQHAVLENRQDAAREYFREAVKICPKGFIEYSSARAELE